MQKNFHQALSICMGHAVCAGTLSGDFKKHKRMRLAQCMRGHNFVPSRATRFLTPPPHNDRYVLLTFSKGKDRKSKMGELFRSRDSIVMMF